MKAITTFSFCLSLLFSQFSFAQDQRENLSQQAANPLADLMSFPFQNNLNMNYGEYNRNTNILNIQPVAPRNGVPAPLLCFWPNPVTGLSGH